jgi:hypothetical protein
LIPDTVPLETEVLKEPENPEEDKGLDFGEIEFSLPCLPTLIKEFEDAATLCLDMIVPPLDGGRLAEDDDV